MGSKVVIYDNATLLPLVWSRSCLYDFDSTFLGSTISIPVSIPFFNFNFDFDSSFLENTIPVSIPIFNFDSIFEKSLTLIPTSIPFLNRFRLYGKFVFHSHLTNFWVGMELTSKWLLNTSESMICLKWIICGKETPNFRTLETFASFEWEYNVITETLPARVIQRNLLHMGVFSAHATDFAHRNSDPCKLKIGKEWQIWKKLWRFLPSHDLKLYIIQLMLSFFLNCCILFFCKCITAGKFHFLLERLNLF